MLRIPEYLLFSDLESDFDGMPVSVLINGKRNMIRKGHVSIDCVRQLISEAAAGRLKFMSFDECPKRVKAIKLDVEKLLVELIVRDIMPSDEFPEQWESY